MRTMKKVRNIFPTLEALAKNKPLTESLWSFLFFFQQFPSQSDAKCFPRMPSIYHKSYEILSLFLSSADEETAEDGDDSSEDESRKKKKKREASTAKKSLKIKAEKQPFQWSSIFGLDRKKKSIGLIYHPLETSKRCGPGGCEQEDYGECLRVVSMRTDIDSTLS